MRLVRDVPALVWAGAVFAVLAVWAHDVRGLYLAGACILLGTLQAARPVPDAPPSPDAPERDLDPGQ